MLRFFGKFFRKNTEKKICKNCKYFDRIYSKCRFNPPVIVKKTFTDSSGFSKEAFREYPNGPHVYYYETLPIVEKDSFCGYWERSIWAESNYE